jgi:sorting nexin-25
MGWGLTVLVAGAAASQPLLARVLTSPWILAAVIPSSIVLVVLAILLAPVACGYLLDIKRPPSTNRVKTAARPLAFSTPAAWQAVLTRSQWTQGAGRPSFKPLHPSSTTVSNAAEEIITLIIRDFVLAWYGGISTSPSFPNAVSATIHSSLDHLLSRANSMDLATLIVKRILPKLTSHVEQFRHSEVALRGATLERRLTQSEELDLLLASRYAGKGRLHPAVANLSSAFTKQTEEAHLKRLVERALPHILPEAEGKSQAVRIVVREIAACSVLYPVVEMLSDPDFWNKMIDSMVRNYVSPFCQAANESPGWRGHSSTVCVFP